MKIPIARYWSLLENYIRDQKKLYLLLSMLLLSSIAFKLVIPQITRLFIDNAQSTAPLSELLIYASAFIAAAILQQVLAVGATWSGELVAWNATNHLRIDVARHSLNLDMAFHKAKTPGEMIQRLDEDIIALAKFFSQLVVVVGGNLILMFGIMVFFFVENFYLGLVFSIFAVSSVLLLNKLREFAIPYEIKRRQAIADLLGYLEERLSGTEDVRSSGAVDYIINGLFRLQSRLFYHWKRVQFRYWILGSISRIVTMLGYSIAFISSFYLYNASIIGIGTSFLIVHYMNLLARPLRELSAQVEGLQGVGASVERLSELLQEKSSLIEGTISLPESGAIAVEFKDVTFGYNADDPVLHQFNLALEPGKVLGILGRTGSGKTTLARLIFRLYDVDTGQISLNSTDITKLRIGNLGHRTAMVTQDVQLFQASVRDNLTFFDNEISDERIISVLRQVELWDWFQRLPNGLDTRLETGGRSMSAGEAQLLAFTRVFLKDPGLVILDEASSRLDPITEARIERAMDDLLANRTAIIIAHRLHTIHRADQILIMDSGRIVEYGNRVELLSDPNSRLSELLSIGLEKELI